MTGPGHALVMGATGLVGSALVRQLLEDGWEVRATVRDMTAAARVADALQDARVVILPDALDGDAVAAVLGEGRPDVVFNCVGKNPSSARDAARGYGEANVAATAVTLDECARLGIERVIVFGSGLEYAESDHALDENAPIQPTTLYGATKVAASTLARYFRRTAGLDVCIVRPFATYGPRDQLNRFVPYVVTSALVGQPIEMSIGTQRRDYLYVEDLAAGLVLLAACSGSSPPVLNFSGPSEHLLIDVAATVVDITGSRSPIIPGARPAALVDPPVFLGDSRLAREMLGWRPAHDLRSGLAKTIEWYRARRELWETRA